MENFSQLNFPRSDFYGFGKLKRVRIFYQQQMFLFVFNTRLRSYGVWDMKYLYDSYDLYLQSRFMKGKM